MRSWLALGMVLWLGACGGRGEITLAPQAALVGAPTTVFVGTSRALAADTGIPGIERRREGVSFHRVTVSIPPDREAGEIGWPRQGQAPDPQRHFLTTEIEDYHSAGAFRAGLRQAIMALPSDQREVTVFTHGFNTSFAEGLYRIAQMDRDLGLPGVMVHYSWPSAAKTLAYVRDRDSALLSRDGLELLLNEVAAAGARRIVIVGHSMGAALTMETLRQMAIRGDRRVRPRIGGVVLMSPDLDVDVFHAQARAMGTLPQPFYIFTSRRDKALALSARLTGQRRDRLGNLRDLAEVADLQVTVVDVAGFSVGTGHLNVAQSPALIRILGQIAEIDRAYGRDAAVKTGLIPAVFLTVRNATGVILSPVTGGVE